MAAGSHGTSAENPHRGLHRVVLFAAALCLVIQVIEGALFVPFVLFYLGFPQVSLQEMCRELYNITYQSDTRQCRYPYPLFSQDFTPEPDLEESKEHVFGPVTPPRPHYAVPAWREMISIVEKRRAAEASQAGVAHE